MTSQQALEIAFQHHQAGRLSEAETCYRQILAAEPNHADALHYLGLIAMEAGQHDLALKLIHRGLALHPDDAKAHANLGELHRQRGRTDEAIASLRRALALQPDLPEAWNNLGNALSERKEHAEAEAAFHRALQLQPNSVAAWTNLGTTFFVRGQMDEAIAAHRNAIRIQPDYAEAYMNLGSALSEQGQSAEAVAALRRAIELEPDSAKAYANLGLALRKDGNFDEALVASRRAAELQPGHGLSHFNYGLLLLLRGDYEQGWPLYEARRNVDGYVDRKFSQPYWDGSALNGRCLLIHAEQGLGDALHCIRYAPLIAARGGRVIVECARALVKLFRTVKGVSEVIEADQPLPPFDVHVPIMSLPGIFKTTLQTIPREIPYLFAGTEDRTAWRHRLGVERPLLRVGLSWAGNTVSMLLRKRHIALEQLKPIVEVANVDFFNLQLGEAAEQLRHFSGPARIIDHTAHIHDFADTAALMAELDLIVTVDTSVAHAAGALGRPVWTLLPFSPDWRWGLGSETTPWYPTMRLFRQPAVGDWESAIRSVAAELSRLAAAHRHK